MLSVAGGKELPPPPLQVPDGPPRAVEPPLDAFEFIINGAFTAAANFVALSQDLDQSDAVGETLHGLLANLGLFHESPALPGAEVIHSRNPGPNDPGVVAYSFELRGSASAKKGAGLAISLRIRASPNFDGYVLD